MTFAVLEAACGGKPAAAPTSPPPATTAAPSPDAAATPAPGADAGAATSADDASAASAAPTAAAEDAGAATTAVAADAATTAPEFKVMTEQFADIRILRYQIPGWDALSPKTRILAWELSEAALAGRDIAWDQRHPDGLRVRRTLEAIDKTYTGDKSAPEYAKFMVYLKRVWFSHGIYHHYSNKKLEPGFAPEYFAALVAASDPKALPLDAGETPEALVKRLTPLLFDPKVDPSAISLDSDKDLVEHSANNFYQRGITQKEVEKFYAAKKDPKDAHPVMWGLNSKLVKQGNDLVELPWKVGGLYGAALEKTVGWLEKAAGDAENEAQKAWIEALIEYYKTGDLTKFDDFSIAWVKDTGSAVDSINGFIETYGDPLDMRGTYEAMVQVRDPVSSNRIATISKNAQWFEDHSAIADNHKKKDVTGISANVVDVVLGVGDSGPLFPIGINLPNSDWIRKEHGSKSVTLGNLVQSIELDRRSAGVLEEFAADANALARAMEHSDLAGRLVVDMHEVIGHASGKLEDGVAPATDTLKNYAGTLEEGRADLVALYFIMDPKLVELGLMPSLEVGKAAYDEYILNGLLVQLARLAPGENIEEAHMRDRHMIAQYILDKGGDAVVSRIEREPGKTAFVIRDYDKMRTLVGELLKEVQRVKSTGDYAAGKALVETYGVKVDQKLADEVRARYAKLGVAPYKGFINPRLVPVEEGGKVVDVKVEYPDDFADQMREYATKYSFLPTSN
ncbi:MAG: dihydrofolate reductase [Myxococcota bacterium]